VENGSCSSGLSQWTAPSRDSVVLTGAKSSWWTNRLPGRTDRKCLASIVLPLQLAPLQCSARQTKSCSPHANDHDASRGRRVIPSARRHLGQCWMIDTPCCAGQSKAGRERRWPLLPLSGWRPARAQYGSLDSSLVGSCIGLDRYATECPPRIRTPPWPDREKTEGGTDAPRIIWGALYPQPATPPIPYRTS